MLNVKSSLKKLEWINPNKPLINTGHRAFDRFCNYINTGNVIADGFLGLFIRSHNETSCNDHMFTPGTLQDFDLKPFIDRFSIPAHVLKSIRDLTIDETGILYAFYHQLGGIKIVHGYILTRDGSKNYERLAVFHTGPTMKSMAVLDWCKDYMSTAPLAAAA